MSLSDCIRCSETPCGCGWSEAKQGKNFILKQIQFLKKLSNSSHDWKHVGYEVIECSRCSEKLSHSNWSIEKHTRLCPNTYLNR